MRMEKNGVLLPAVLCSFCLLSSCGTIPYYSASDEVRDHSFPIDGLQKTESGPVLYQERSRRLFSHIQPNKTPPSSKDELLIQGEIRVSDSHPVKSFWGGVQKMYFWKGTLRFQSTEIETTLGITVRAASKSGDNKSGLPLF